jgi:hypothetical protein
VVVKALAGELPGPGAALSRWGAPELAVEANQRAGALAYQGASEVHRAQVFGRLEPTTGIEPFSGSVKWSM